jgi:HlyD family secretion protein
VREGAQVKAGQLLARLDDAVLQAQFSQAGDVVGTTRLQISQAEDAVRTAQVQLAQAGDTVETARVQLAQSGDLVATAKATLAQVARPPLASDVARLKADIAQSIAVAEARLAGAKEKLAELQQGATSEERDQMQAQTLQAEANLTQAKRELARQKALFSEGAVAQNLVDNAETAELVARRTLENLQARWKQMQVGTRTEQLAQAKAEVRVGEATVAGAKASGAQQLKSLLSQPRKEDIAVAENKLKEAKRGQLLAAQRVKEAERTRELTRNRVQEAGRARDVAAGRLSEINRSVTVAQTRLKDTAIVAPFDGTVTKILTEAGSVTGPNAPVLQLVRTSTPEIRIDVDEGYLGRIVIGQEAKVTCKAYPGESFAAKIREIGAEIDNTRGTVEVRLKPVTPPAWIRPGQTVDVNIVVDKGSERLVVPLTAVNTIGGISTVYVVENSVVAEKIVKIAAAGPTGVPIVSGIEAGSDIIITRTGLDIGKKVAPVQKANAFEVKK